MQALVVLALNVFHEARAEPLEGQIAVAEVTLRRTLDKRWGGSVQDVVFSPSQFSWTAGKTPTPELEQAARALEPRAWGKALAVAAMVLAGAARPVVPGATHYCRVDVHPAWVDKAVLIREIGQHRFYKMKDERYR